MRQIRSMVLQKNVSSPTFKKRKKCRSTAHMSGSRSLEKDEMEKFLNKGLPCGEEKEEGEIEDEDDVSNESAEMKKLELQKKRKKKWDILKSQKKICYETEDVDGVMDMELSNQLINQFKSTNVRLANMAKLTNNNDSHNSDNIVEDAQMVTIKKECEAEYCMSLFEAEECTVKDCSSSHILDPITARDHLGTVAQKYGDTERPEKILVFWRFHSNKSASNGAAILSRLTEMCTNGTLVIDLKGYSELVTWIQLFPEYYTVTNESTYVVMKELLEGAAKVVEKGNNGGKGIEVSTIINWAWKKIYLASSFNGMVMKQEVHENICALLKARGLFCLLSELLYICNMSPTLYVPMGILSSLLSQLPNNVSSISNVFNCQCGNNHNGESCISIAKILSRLPFTDFSNLNNRLKNLPSKLNLLVTIVKDNMDGEDLARFVHRIEDLDIGISLPQVSDRHNALNDSMLQKIGEEKWEDMARSLVAIENCYIEMVVKHVEDLYRVVKYLPEHMASMVFEKIYNEFERIQHTGLQKELFCQLGLSLMLHFVASGHTLDTVGILYTLVRSHVDLSRLKPLLFFDLEDMVESESSLSVPVFVIDLCLEIGNVELAAILIKKWKYLTGHPKIRHFNDLEHQNKLLEKILEKSLTLDKSYSLKTYITCLRIFDILCDSVAQEWPLEKKDKMTQYGKTIFVHLLNGGMTGLDLWEAAVTANRCLNVVAGEVARGMVVRLVQANMMKEARIVYNWPGGPYETQAPQPNKKGTMIVISLIQSFYSSEELRVILIDYFYKLKKADYAGNKGVFIQVWESPPPSSRIICLKNPDVTKIDAIVRVRQILANMEPSLSLKDGVLMPFIPPQLMLEHISHNLKNEY